MRKRRRDQDTLCRNQKSRLAEQADKRPSASAAKELIRKTYACSDVLGYVAEKYDIKGEIGIGEEGI